MGRRLNKESFIERSKILHGDVYDYSKVEYKNTYTKVEIVCKHHGSFCQTPSNHFHYGCKFCGGTYKSNTEEFIKKAKEIHVDKYDYDYMEYVNMETPILMYVLSMENLL